MTSENCCPFCGSSQMPCNHTRTFYGCGSSIFENRIKTIQITNKCRKRTEIYLHSLVETIRDVHTPDEVLDKTGRAAERISREA